MTESAKQQTDAEIRAAAESGLKMVCDVRGIAFIAERARLVDTIVKMARSPLGVDRATFPSFVEGLLNFHVECVARTDEFKAKLFSAMKEGKDGAS